MINYLLPILAVLSGLLFVLVVRPEKKDHLKLLLAFSGSFLLALTVFDLLPEVYEHDSGKKTGIFIMTGIFLQVFLEYFSHGAEHGHVHPHVKRSGFPWLLFTSLSIHSLLEGFPMHEHETLVYGIVVHKVPIAIILSTFFLDMGMQRNKVIPLLVVFALMTPLGSFLAFYFDIMKTYYHEISAIVIGIFLHISTIILFESTENHRYNIRKLVVILLGVTAAFML
ncbi:ZIP family metal transporter [Ascidiimonas aurantiaca]|uniref:ZIP family metal transporter n=1 Tax=Ascidiimonas aurantiaca TaxID=1685432 RepID=UPI0030EF17DD